MCQTAQRMLRVYFGCIVVALLCAGVPAAAPASPAGQPSSSETSCDDVAVTGNESVKKVVKSRRKFKNELTTRLVAAARAALAAPETGHLLAFVTEQYQANNLQK